LLGREVVLVDATDELVAFYIEYEGEPGPPLAALKAERAGDTVRLTWRLNPKEAIEQLGADTGVIRGNTLEFRPYKRVVRGDTLEFPGNKLVRTKTLQRALRAARKPSCR